MSKIEGFIYSDNNQLDNTNNDPINVNKRNTSFKSYIKSNLGQFIILIILFIIVLFLSIRITLKASKYNQLQASIDKTRTNIKDIDTVSLEQKQELNIMTKTNENLSASIKKNEDLLLSTERELDGYTSSYHKMEEDRNNYLNEGKTIDFNALEAENKKLLFELAKHKQVTNRILNNNISGGISEIISNTDDIKLLEQWAGKKMLFACYNTHMHPMSGKQFHHQCNMYSETITLIRLKDQKVIGGFTSKDWRGNQDKYDDKAFIFNLTTRRRYDIQKGKVATCPNEEDMPTFSRDIALTKDIYYVKFPDSYGSFDDREGFGFDGTLIQPDLIEVIVLG